MQAHWLNPNILKNAYLPESLVGRVTFHQSNMGYGIIRRGLRSAARMARRYSPYSVPAAGAVGMSVAAGYRYGRTLTKTKKKFTSGSGVTNQYNATLQYRKRRMPRRKRGQWKRFVRKVRAVNMRSQASRTFVFNNSIQVDATGGN